jgi:hypothetical protein
MRRAPFRVGVCPEDRQRPAHSPESVALARGAVLRVDVVHVDWYRYGMVQSSTTLLRP